MATATKTPATETTTKVRKPAPKLTDRIRTQLNGAALRGKITVDEINELQQHLTKIAALLA